MTDTPPAPLTLDEITQAAKTKRRYVRPLSLFHWSPNIQTAHGRRGALMAKEQVAPRS